MDQDIEDQPDVEDLGNATRVWLQAVVKTLSESYAKLVAQPKQRVVEMHCRREKSLVIVKDVPLNLISTSDWVQVTPELPQVLTVAAFDPVTPPVSPMINTRRSRK